MTRQRKAGKIYAEQTELPLGRVNEAVELYLVEEGKEEAELKRLMK